jgi:conjugative relaxase-like TrwC/TraI family protein
MLHVSKAMTSAAVKAYFESPHDYYIDGNNPPGVWGGKLAEEWGLTGEIKKEQFDRLADGCHPTTGEDLVLRRSDNRRSANDITISAPKDLSLLYLRLRQSDPRQAAALLKAFDESCDWIMGRMESWAATRVRKDGADHDRITGNWAYAGFTQFDSRPDGKTLLPVVQIHRHHTVFNLTRDAEEHRITALQIGLVKGQADLFMPMFHNELARRVRALGYGVRRDPATGIVGFSVAGVPRALVEKWSPRRQTILAKVKEFKQSLETPAERERIAKEMGITDPRRLELLLAERCRKLKAELAVLTRRHKQKNLSQDELWRFWDSQLTKADRQALDAARGEKGWVTTDADAARFAIGHLFHTRSVVPEKKLLAEGLRYGVGSVSADGLKKEMARQGVIVVGGEATTKEVRNREARIKAFARDGRGKWRPVSAKPDLRLLLDNAGSAIRLTGEQEGAVRALLASRDAVNVCDAGQGTGKTTMLETYGRALSRCNVRSTWLGTTHTAVGELQARGLPAMTLARFLASEAEQKKAAGSRLIVDEASMLAHGDADRLCQYAKDNGCRIDFIGDSKQYKSPVAGDTLALLTRFAGVRPITMTRTMRQQGRLKEAMEAIRDGEVLKGHDTLDALGMVHEMAQSKLAGKAAELYLAWSEKGRPVPVISPTWAQAAEISARIRAGLKARDDLTGEDRMVRRLVNLNWSPAQLEEARKHGAGEGVVLTRSGAYREDTLALAVGDLVRTTMSGKSKDGRHKLNNGQRYSIAGFTEADDPILNNGWVVDKNWGGLASSYVTTGQGAQGVTAQKAIVVYGTPSLVATRQEGFYVPVSRVRQEVAVLTDSNAALREAIQKQDHRKTATELLASRRRSKASLKQRLGKFLAYQQRQAAFERAQDKPRPEQERPPLIDRGIHHAR